MNTAGLIAGNDNRVRFVEGATTNWTITYELRH